MLLQNSCSWWWRHMSIHPSALEAFILLSERKAKATFPRNHADLAAQGEDFISALRVFLSLFIQLFPFWTESEAAFFLCLRSSYRLRPFAKWLHYLRRDSASRSTKAFWKRSLFSGFSGKWKMLSPDRHTSVLYEPDFSSNKVTLWPPYQQKPQSGAAFLQTLL